MGGSIRYYGRVAEYKTHIVDGEVKWDLIFEGINDLECLLKMGETNIVYVDGEGMRFSKFESEMLSKVHRIYPTKMEWVKDITNTPEFEAAMKKVRGE
ncbi:MAG: hypothetical protein AABX50_01005 [Nanoarchaeota archaeon]